MCKRFRKKPSVLKVHWWVLTCSNCRRLKTAVFSQTCSTDNRHRILLWFPPQMFESIIKYQWPSTFNVPCSALLRLPLHFSCFLPMKGAAPWAICQSLLITLMSFLDGPFSFLALSFVSFTSSAMPSLQLTRTKLMGDKSRWLTMIKKHTRRVQEVCLGMATLSLMAL